MTVSQAAKVLNVNPSTVRRWVQRGQVPAQKWGSVYYINPDDLNLIPAHRSGRECAAAAVAALDGLLDAVMNSGIIATGSRHSRIGWTLKQT